MKIYTLIGGVNGAGKSSLTGSLRSERNDFGIVVDPDKLTIQCGGDEYEGGKLAVERIERALMDGVNFTPRDDAFRWISQAALQTCKRSWILYSSVLCRS